jgi:hypothetical protein
MSAMALLEELKPGVMVKGLFSCVFFEYKNTHCKFDTEKQILLQCLWHAWSASTIKQYFRGVMGGKCPMP